MEQVQQVQVHIAAAKLGDAKVLIDDLEAHRRELQGMRGFVGMRITRSAEAGGDALLNIETRWRDEAALDAYNGMTRTAESVINAHGDIIVPGSLQVRSAESLEGAEVSGASVGYERWALALLVPGGILVIGLGIIYGLSRLYIEWGSNGAIPLASIVAVGILLLGWYFAANPRVPVWQIGGVGVGVVAFLIGGTVYAQVSPGPEIHREAHSGGEETPGAEPTPGGPPPSGNVLELHDNYFSTAGDGEQNPTVTFTGGADVTIDLSNEGTAIHNMHIAASGEYERSICRTGPDAPCSDPASIRGGQAGTITFNLPPGSYDYRCDFHTADMNGTLVVE